MSDLIGLAIICGLALFIIQPLLAARRGAWVPDTEGERELLRQRDTLYREIADLDFDHRTGKVGDADYHAQRDEYLEEAAAVLRALDERPISAPAVVHAAPATEIDDAIEREVRRLRARSRRR